MNNAEINKTSKISVILASIPENPDRAETIALIKRALKIRSGKNWSVTGGKGTAYGWIYINVAPAKRTWKNIPAPGNEIMKNPGRENWIEINDPSYRFGHMGPKDREELTKLLGLDSQVSRDGHSIPASSDYRREYIDRACGFTPRKIAKPYWDN